MCSRPEDAVRLVKETDVTGDDWPRGSHESVDLRQMEQYRTTGRYEMPTEEDRRSYFLLLPENS